MGQAMTLGAVILAGAVISIAYDTLNEWLIRRHMNEEVRQKTHWRAHGPDSSARKPPGKLLTVLRRLRRLLP